MGHQSHPTTDMRSARDRLADRLDDVARVESVGANDSDNITRLSSTGISSHAVRVAAESGFMPEGHVVFDSGRSIVRWVPLPPRR